MVNIFNNICLERIQVNGHIAAAFEQFPDDFEAFLDNKKRGVLLDLAHLGLLGMGDFRIFP